MASKAKQICKYGAGCYRKNRAHLENYDHSKREDDDDKKEESSSSGEEDKRSEKSSSENKENKVDLSKTIDMRDDDNEGFDNVEKIDLTKVHGSFFAPFIAFY